MPTLKIDGQEITVPPNTNLVEAAKLVGKEIPTFCYHPHLSIAANCRMCLVTGKQGGRAWPKALPACQTIAADTMEVDTQGAETQRVQKGVLEFILINHPLDCPVCDKAGECELQDNFFKYSKQPSRFAEHKEAKVKTCDIGPQVIYDGERCINCTRCVRFMDEIARDPQLAQIHRGDRSFIAPAEGRQLDHPYAMNTVDLCPVGALLGKDFRFHVRAWFLASTPSVCSGCARGCNVQVDASRVDQQVHRIRPRENAAVNGPWMCDDGRWTYHHARDHRLTGALVKDAKGAANPATLEAAVRRAAALLKPYLGSAALAVSGSAHLTCEDHFVLATLQRELFKAATVGLHGRAPWKGDTFLKLADRNPNTRGALAVLGGMDLKPAAAEDLLGRIDAGAIKALVLVGTELPATDADRLRATLARLDVLVTLSAERGVATEVAHVALPIAWSAEVDGLWMNGFGRLQRLRPAVPPPGSALPAWRALEGLGRALEYILKHDGAAAVLGELATRVAAFHGVTYAAVGAAGLATAGDTKAPKHLGEGKQPSDFPMPNAG